MTHRKLIVIAAAASLLSGCEPEPPEQRLSVVTRGTEPIYQMREDGRIAATACLTGHPAGYGSTPSACTVDSVFGQQIANPQDMIAPRSPGPSYAARPAQAAYEYIYGEMPTDGQHNGPQPSILIPVEADPQADNGGGEEEQP